MNRILVVDDEPDINMLLMIILEDAGFKVDLYEDPIRALLNFRPGLYDLAILDIIMPTMNGYTFYKRIKYTTRCSVISSTIYKRPLIL